MGVCELQDALAHAELHECGQRLYGQPPVRSHGFYKPPATDGLVTADYRYRNVRSLPRRVFGAIARLASLDEPCVRMRFARRR